MAMDTKALRREIVNRSGLCQSLYQVVIGATVGGLPRIDFGSGAAFGMAAKDSASVTSSQRTVFPPTAFAIRTASKPFASTATLCVGMTIFSPPPGELNWHRHYDSSCATVDSYGRHKVTAALDRLSLATRFAIAFPRPASRPSSRTLLLLVTSCLQGDPYEQRECTGQALSHPGSG